MASARISRNERWTASQISPATKSRPAGISAPSGSPQMEERQRSEM
nr:MAG TPA: hypothetical protein [Caudoviricetes sp.]